MATVNEFLGKQLAAALSGAGFEGARAEVSPATDPRFGDYQSNAAMILAKREKANPRVVAEQIIRHFEPAGLCQTPEIAGAGFVNFRLLDSFIASAVSALAKDDRLGVAYASPRKKIVLDFSSPNVAKPMHVGHIRSTILGDCLARVARFLGHNVTTDNHIGDWGTQFGKVIYGWKHLRDASAMKEDAIAELVRLYREVNLLEESDAAVKAEAREELVKLQSGDPENLAIWQETVDLSWSAFQTIYDRLGVAFDERLGESAYRDALAPLCDELQASGIAEISEGALCVFFRETPNLAEKPAMIRKADGGFLYATSDMATIHARIARWNPDAIWYVVGSPQALHFEQMFALARRVGVTCELEHIAFGSILGEDRKMMKTRSGENISLHSLLDEAVERASALIASRSADLEDAATIAETIGIGAVKYAELSQSRLTDYVFAWSKFLAFEGNTAPYLQNAYVRIRSIFRKAGHEADLTAPVVLSTPAERSLALCLLRYAETVPLVLESFRPNLMANYLYELANAYHAFYEACPVLKSESPVRESRLLLSHLTSQVLAHGLGLLGIRCPERM